MRLHFAIVFAAILALAGTGRAERAQAAGQPDPRPAGLPSGFTAALANADMDTIREVDAAERTKSKTEGAKLIAALQLSCLATETQRLAHGKIQAQGKRIDVNVYEVACDNGTGYLLVSQESQKPQAISCFAAAATHAADVAEGKKSELYCRLGANKDIKAIATNLLSETGTHCGVRDVKWFGMNAATQTEFTEVACEDRKGYLLKIAQTGPSPQVSVISCQEAAGQGLKCHLTDVGSAPAKVSMQALQDAITHNAVRCESPQMRLIGRESVDRRYVVELHCSSDPYALVAFVPLEDSIAPFEILDCKTAQEQRNVRCTLTEN